MSSHAPSNNQDDDRGGFKVYGSVFKVDARYELLNPLGKGSYGVVCAARDKETGQRLAIKKVCPMAKRSVDAKHTLREVLLLQLLGKHPNIISIHNLSTNLKDDELYIVMDLMDTDMHRVIQSSQALSESHVKYFLHQLLRGVKYLHENGVLHRDLKPGNLLLTKTCQLKIADFGLARKMPKPTGGGLAATIAAASALTLPERPRSAPAAAARQQQQHLERAPMTEHVVTRWYRAPELMLQPDGCYDESVDMWSVGCIFAEILGRKALFPGKNFLHQLTLIFEVIGTPPTDATARIKSSQAQRFLKSLGKKPKVPFRTLFPNASDEALDLLDRLLEFDPDKRLTAQEALAHPYMQPIERKYKGIDPHPATRLDFSFDSKKLTKLDLRNLIVKEVDTFRRSVAHTAALDNAPPAVDVTSVVEPKAGSVQKSESNLRDRTRPASATASAASAAQGRVMCGSAGISMMTSSLRNQTHENTTSATSTASATVTIGSNRARIRVATKPPVPKQLLAPASTSIGLQGQVRVVSGPESQHLLLSAEPHTSTEPPNTLADSVGNLSKGFLTTGTVHGSLDHGSEQQKPSVRGPSTAAPTPTHDRRQQPQQPPQQASQGVHLEQRARTTASVIAALEDRSRALAAPLAVVPAMLDSSRGGRAPQAPETSSSPTPAAAEPSPQRSSSSSSPSPSPPPRESERAEFVAPVRSGQETALERSVAALSGLPRRRVASAGAVRSKPAHIVASVIRGSNSSSTTTTNNNNNNGHSHQPGLAAPMAFVGSTNSLIRAQRSNNGQSLSEAADEVVATIAARDAESERRPEHGDAATLKPQRSTTQLNQHDPAGRKPTKKLTVPKSPKFSVMSWQKKTTVTGAARIGGIAAAAATVGAGQGRR